MSHSGSLDQRSSRHGRAPKRAQILVGASEVFREVGFERASVDEIAARAQVSKATVYKHFQDKRTLYAAFLSQEADDLRESVRCMLIRSEPLGDVRLALQHAGERLLALALDPALIRFYRNATAEAERFPEVAQTLFDNGPGAMIEVIADFLWRWHESGALCIEDRREAAIQFVMLCHGDLVVRAQFGVLPNPLQPAIVATVGRAVTTFVRAYAPPPAHPPPR